MKENPKSKIQNPKSHDFQFKVQRIEQTCLFELGWGEGQHLSVTLPYPQNLTIFYNQWQKAYLNYYQKALRGRVAEIGSIAPTEVDWHARLVQAEAKLLSEFHLWLRSAELYEIRRVIAKAAQNEETNIFLTCNPLELARLPWEAWEIATEFAAYPGKIRIARTAVNIHQGVKYQNFQYRRMRVLVILGDDTGLEFKVEKKALASIKKIAEVKFIGWQPGETAITLKNQIKNAIASEQGWDILFFAGHSNETELTGGEIGIAPNTALSISEITPPLTTAIEKGLQFALFNSCSGLSIANSLIDFGLSQVAVMREPIHNSVAEEFLLRFLQALAEYKDVHEALLFGCQYLKVEKSLTYPSAYLIPSLFRHPKATLFCLEETSIKQRLKNLLPTPIEAIALIILCIISLQLPVQKWLLGNRVLLEAVYRQLQGDNTPVVTPPVLLVEIDNDSIKKAKISIPNPINRQYLASIVDKVNTFHPTIVGIDYVLDRYQGQNDRLLATSIQKGVSANHTWLIFGETSDEKGELLSPISEISSPRWSLQGDIENLFPYMQLLSASKNTINFATLLTLSKQLNQLPGIPQPQLQSKSDFWQQINSFLHRDNQYNIMRSRRIVLQSLTEFSYSLGQMWLHPIIDFSIPPNQAYQTIPAWKLLEQNPNSLSHSNQQIVIIAAGGYAEAGINKADEDNYHDVPPAVRYWWNQSKSTEANSILTGGEVNAYIVENLLNNRLVTPIPDLWMIVVAIFIGKYLSYLIKKYPHARGKIYIIISTSTVAYAFTSLQLYLSPLAIVLPCFLPCVTVWLYVAHTIFPKKTYE